MFDMRAGVGSARLIVVLSRVAAMLAALFVSACASSGQRSQVAPEYRVGSPTARVAGYRHDIARVELEDDGIVGQVAPKRRRKIERDDPREPFSPMYGSVPAVTAADVDVADVDVGTDGYDPFLDGPQWDIYKQKAREDAAFEARRAKEHERVSPVAFVQRAGSRR